MDEGEERVLVDARHRRLQDVAADDLDLGKDVVAQDVVEQLDVLVALDAQVVRDGEELALRLLRDQVEQQPRRVDDAELRVGFHLGDGGGDLVAEDAVVVGDVDDVAAGRLRQHELPVAVAADVGGVTQRADRQAIGVGGDRLGGGVGRAVVGDHQLEREREVGQLHDQALEE